MVRQGVRVIAFHAVSAFSPDSDSEEGRQRLEDRCRRLGVVRLAWRDITAAQLAMVRAPRYGRGRNLNPCLDCHIEMLRQAAEILRETAADFLASGEVLGQRPMSQRREALQIIDRHLQDWGLEGRLLRPLSAKLLPPTLPESEGWIAREALKDFQGRNRKPQLALARELGVEDYNTPAGGCLLTDRGFAGRLRDLLVCQPDLTIDDVLLLRTGRHHRLNAACKAVSSRCEEENRRLQELARPGDRLFITAQRPGAIVLLRCRQPGPENCETAERIAAGLAVYFSKFRHAGRADVWCWQAEKGESTKKLLPTCMAISPQQLLQADAKPLSA